MGKELGHVQLHIWFHHCIVNFQDEKSAAFATRSSLGQTMVVFGDIVSENKDQMDVVKIC